MNKYRVFKIENKNGQIISNNDQYSKMGNAKNAANNVIWKMDEDTNIVEYEITEVPVAKTKINLEVINTTRKNWRGENMPHQIKRIIGYGELKESKIEVKPESKISFNN